jgi:hypothetical protein
MWSKLAGLAYYWIHLYGCRLALYWLECVQQTRSSSTSPTSSSWDQVLPWLLPFRGKESISKGKTSGLDLQALAYVTFANMQPVKINNSHGWAQGYVERNKHITQVGPRTYIRENEEFNLFYIHSTALP